MGVAYNSLSMKSGFSQMRPIKSRFDYERGAFCLDLIVNEFKQIGLIRSIGLLVMNATIVCYKRSTVPLDHA